MHFKYLSTIFIFSTLFVVSVFADWTNFWEGLKNKFTGGGGSGGNGNSGPFPPNSFGQPPNGQGQFGPGGLNFNDRMGAPQQNNGPNPPYGQQSPQMPPKAEGNGGIFSGMARKLMNFLAKGGKDDHF